jgi:hypothetical protein
MSLAKLDAAARRVRLEPLVGHDPTVTPGFEPDRALRSRGGHGLLFIKQSERTFENRQRVLDALSDWTQNPNAWVSRWRIKPNVREIEI